MNMAHGLIAANNGDPSSLEDVSITIKKVENGFILNLSGEKENVHRKKEPRYARMEDFRADFVYSDLRNALDEIDGFFDLIEEQLNKKTKK